MSIWGSLFTQPCAVWRFQGLNDSGDKEYSPPENQPPAPFTARIERAIKEVLDTNGNRILSEARLLAEEPLKPLDKVSFDHRAWIVKTASPVYSVLGELDHWEVYL